MYTIFHVSKKAFTLIELMIVMSIIGILASALYPSVTGYFQRAKVVEYQTWASDYIKIANTYNNEVWSLEWPLETATGEYYYLHEVASTYPSHWHQNFSQFILKNNPNFWNKLRKMRSPSIPSDYWMPYIDSWPLYTWEWVYNIRFPGRDMTSNIKVHAISWAILWIAPEVNVWDYFALSWSVSSNSNTNMSMEANKRCSPGIAWQVENTPPEFVYTMCIYFLD